MNLKINFAIDSLLCCHHNTSMIISCQKKKGVAMVFWLCSNVFATIWPFCWRLFNRQFLLAVGIYYEYHL